MSYPESLLHCAISGYHRAVPFQATTELHKEVRGHTEKAMHSAWLRSPTDGRYARRTRVTSFARTP